MESIFFLVVAAVAVISSILVVTCKNPINSALSLVMTFFCLATFYVMLDAPFMAATQVIVYAGAIMVLIIFVIMLLNVRVETVKRGTHAVIAGSAIGLFILFQTVWFLMKGSMTGKVGDMTKEQIVSVGHVELIGKALFTDFLLPFEVTSVLLLAAIVGAVILAKKKI
ncbi:NADH-quinone oxidoreductase subunit J [Geomonas sp. Red69]|uniref:NADH-quinone oxidoreductase subunit J n=1 Tax=Geomonas diazotrophica TaxID=2843197 RepID=A0ABX8JP62_9BACT|nr:MULTISPECIES: NADH-quinone oxidoreductase subunit J [Geomonas]MBU5638517.1 NADH-quinone oxidoreductase subunit J [Geomonas diazotrophica]QWV97215.1 NADH-quinone oxidoreductase subunit J [Geomonas nitrogeniifigens]QXE86386.1 NADH-quinone oxidoreductase subunit J [Geomonas nitrogeniifigens]